MALPYKAGFSLGWRGCTRLWPRYDGAASDTASPRLAAPPADRLGFRPPDCCLREDEKDVWKDGSAVQPGVPHFHGYHAFLPPAA